MTRQQRDLINAMDQRAKKAMATREQQQKIELGVIKAVTLSGASVQLSESARFLQNVPSIAGVELVIGATVLVVRAGRRDWVILGAVETGNSATATINNTTPISKVASLAIASRYEYMEILWTASYFDVRCYELQVNTSESEVGAYTVLTDNTQHMYYDDAGTYYARVRAIGPQWHTGAWSDWEEGTIESTSLLTLTAAADGVLELDEWELDLDKQFLNTFFGCPVGSVSDFPEFRTLELADLPDAAIQDVFVYGHSGAVTVRTGARRVHVPWDITIIEVYTSVNTAGSDPTTVDVHKNGTTIFTTQASRPSMASGEYFATSGTPDVDEADAGDYLTVDTDVAGTGASDLYTTILYQKR